MAKVNELEYDTTPANNTDINSIGIQGSNAVSNFDNALRQLMAYRNTAITKRVAKASASGPFTAAKTDYNQLWDVTGSTALTINLTAAATLTTGWCLWIRNSSTANITIDPSSTEQIDGATTVTVLPNNSVLIVCNGTAFYSLFSGNASPANNGQFRFPSTPNASSDANTLDDYVEGQTTPTVTSGTGTITSASCTLNYTKIGRQVEWTAVITITTNGTGATDLRITLPYTAGASAFAGGYDNTGNLALTGIVATGGSTAVFFKYDGTYPGVSGRTYVVGGTYRI